MCFHIILIEVIFSVLLQVIEGNSNTYLGSKRELDPPVWASKIRFIPYSYHRRTVCMRVEIYGCYWNGRFWLIHRVLTCRISLLLDILLRHFSQVVVWKCQRVIWCHTVSEKELIFRSLKEPAGIAQYQRGSWYFIVSITSWHHTVTARKLIFHSVSKRAGITHCRRSEQAFNPIRLWR